ncbi:MAG: dihydropteroate synthase [Desulfatitalea sp.]|nr:dihydropteroate synthase [Desulfatitalea sp.]
MIIAADNLRITDPTIAMAIERYDPAPIAAMIRRCEAAGADWIDLNAGPLSREPEKRMTFLVEAVCAVTRLPLLLDTVNPRALGAGLAASRNPTAINGFSLEPSKLARILPLARQYGCDIIGYLLYPDSQVPPDESELIGVALALYDAFHKAGLDDSQLIIDPVVAPLIWADGAQHNRHLLALIRNLPDLLGFPVRTIAGLSNLSTGRMPKPVKHLLQRAFLPMLAAAGLRCALMDAFQPETVQTARACEAMCDSGIFSWGQLISP